MILDEGFELKGNERPIEYVIKDQCWVCVSHKPFSFGYILIMRKRKRIYLHRYSYELKHGPIPAGLQILHSCDNPSCINPGHMSLGTQTDNMTDKVSKQRQAKGNEVPQAKLNPEKVKAIRKDHRYLKEIAADYGVAISTIWNVKAHTTWKSVKELTE